MIEAFIKCPLFHGVSEEELTAVLPCLRARRVSYKKNETISKIINLIEKNQDTNIDHINKYFTNSKNKICPFCFRDFDENYRKELISNIKQIRV